MKRGKKRGLSPVIASVLMIMLVLVLAAMIFLWARGFISEQIEKFGKPVEDLCADVNFKVLKVDDGHALEILNKGNIDIWYFNLKMFDDSGNSKMTKFDVRVDAGKAIKQEVALVMADETEPEKIIIYPALLGSVRGKDSNQAYVCTNAGVTI